MHPTTGAMWALMIQTEPESAPLKSACGAPIAMSGSPSPVMSPTLATLTPTCWSASAGKSMWKKYGYAFSQRSLSVMWTPSGLPYSTATPPPPVMWRSASGAPTARSLSPSPLTSGSAARDIPVWEFCWKPS